MAPGNPSFRVHGHGPGHSKLRFFKRGDEVLLVSTGQDGRIKIWSSAGELLRQTDEIDCDGPVHCLAVRPDGEVIAAGNETAVNVSTEL
jgi:WD40 repeat protein